MSELSTSEKRERAALERIPELQDPVRLRAMIENARKLGSARVERAAFKRLCEIQPSAERGSLAWDVWRSVHALEEILTAERGKTVRLLRTRPKIERDGEARTVEDIVLKSEATERFGQLIERGHAELTFEAVVLRHAHEFGAHACDAAKRRLIDVDVDPVIFGPSP